MKSTKNQDTTFGVRKKVKGLVNGKVLIPKPANSSIEVWISQIAGRAFTADSCFAALTQDY